MIDESVVGPYKLYAEGTFGNGHREYIGARFVCRFCGRGKPEATFKKKAHAIPEFMGNHRLILNSECDDCNKHFGDILEPHLAIYTGPFRALQGITNKSRKTPKHRDDKVRELHFDRHNNNLRIMLADDDAIEQIDENSTRLILNRPSFKPYLAYQALCKIAMSVIDDQMLPLFSKTLDWLNPRSKTGLIVNNAQVIEGLVPGANLREGIYRLFLHSSHKKPHCMFWITCGGYTIQACIPMDFDLLPDKQTESTIPFVPDYRSAEMIERFGPMGRFVRDFSSPVPLLLPHETIFRFTTMEEITP